MENNGEAGHEPSDAEVEVGAKRRSARYLLFFLWRVAAMFMLLAYISLHYVHHSK